MGILWIFYKVSIRFLSVRVLWERVFKCTKWKRVFREGLLGIPSKEGFSSLLGLLGSLALGFFGEGFSGLLACGVFAVFALYFVGLALGGGLLGVNFLLGC